ncbi:hypothetical protein [Pacificimonas flava]|uniref:Uncharacterized protein n=1 Tax=Pacificimonas flava TaxID=1234595 RepID=M2U4J7_9SPHN|nr:hypothetical protein [Pacificimonas flava]EMD82893.1 hypothetical protein C725_1491 [Pacificimonas flava]MBB5280056.1 hypothetical protein [Pacificimonas flava]
MARNRPFKEPPGTGLDDRAEQRRATLDKRQALLSKMAKERAERSQAAGLVPRAPAAPERNPRDVERYMAALAAQPFHRLGLSEVAAVTPAYQRIVRSAAEVASDGSVQVVMPWPPVRISPSAIAALLTIAAVGSAEQERVTSQGATEMVRRRSDEVRAVVFPYARSTHAQARQVHVGRHKFGAVNFEHVKRYMNGGGDAAKDFHQVLGRVRNLTGRASDGRDYAEFEHPILDEIVPHATPRGERASNSFLLWRTRSKTDIAKQSRSNEADDRDKADFFLYTLRAGERIGVDLRAIKRSPDLLILDLTRNARNRLGWNWVEKASEMVACLREVHPATGVLAIADDPWTYRTARFDILGTRRPGKNGKQIPAPGHVTYSQTPDIVQPVSISPSPFEGGARIEAGGFFGDTAHGIEAVRHLANSLSDRGDPNGAETARNLMATIRRTASLPGSLAELARFMEREASAAAASDLLSVYRAAADIGTLADPRSLASQVDADGGTLGKARDIMRTFNAATPMTTLLESVVKPAVRSSSKSVFVFRSDLVAEFAADRLSGTEPKLAARIESEFVRFGGERVLKAVADLPQGARNQFKRVVIVAPTRTAILTTLSQPWLPEQVAVLADADTLAFAARDAERLANEIGIAPLAVRLRNFASKAKARVEEIGRHVVRFEMPTDDIEFPNGTVVDLSGGGRGERKLVEIELKNKQRIIARRSTEIVLRDDGAATTSFVERPASAVKPGDEVCVIGHSFVERARTLVNIQATASEEIRDYHELVAERFAAIPEPSIQAKLRTLVARMGDQSVTTERARYWIDLANELEKPLHDVVPHAPSDRETFMRFTKALEIGEGMASNFWRWAVVAQRSHRLRYGNVFHDAFRGILTDPHATMASNRDRTDQIRLLRSMAEEHVAVVDSVRSFKG